MYTHVHTQMYVYTSHTHEINKQPPHIHKIETQIGRFVLRTVTGS